MRSKQNLFNRFLSFVPILTLLSLGSIQQDIAAQGSTISAETTTTMAETCEDKKKEYHQDGEDAKQIAKYLPYFPFKGIPRFYDIGGFLAEPEIFQKIIDIFASRYGEIGIDSVAG